MTGGHLLQSLIFGHQHGNNTDALQHATGTQPNKSISLQFARDICGFLNAFAWGSL